MCLRLLDPLRSGKGGVQLEDTRICAREKKHCQIHESRICLAKARFELKVIFEHLLSGPWIHFHQVPDAVIDTAWARMQGKFTFNDDEVARNAVVYHASNRWSDWMYRIRNPVFRSFKTREERIAHPPAHIDPDIWKTMVDLWSSERFQTSRSRNKVDRGTDHISHTSGCVPFAERRYALEKMEAMRDSRNTETSTADASSSEVNGEMDDMSIYKQVMGDARSGQVPGYGKGPSPSQVFGTQRHNQEAEREKMRQEIAKMEARVRVKIREEVQAQIQTQVQAQVVAFLRNMGFQAPLVLPSARVNGENGERVENEDSGKHGDE